MKRFLLLFVSMITVSVLAQDADTTDNWIVGGETSLNVNQASFTNWAAGGENSVSLNGFLNLYANYSKGKSAWDNKVELGYGMLKTGTERWKKTDDKIFLSSKYGYKANKSWYYSGVLSFRSQFSDGFVYGDIEEMDSLVSSFMAPGYITISFGMDYKPKDNFSLLLAPFSGKMTAVMNDSLSKYGAFGVDPGEKTRFEFGASIKMSYRREIVKNVNFETYLALFSNYLENPQNIDILWDVMINMKVNEWLSANLTTNLIYDDDIKIKDADGNIGPRIQFKQLFGVGITYKFSK